MQFTGKVLKIKSKDSNVCFLSFLFDFRFICNILSRFIVEIARKITGTLDINRRRALVVSCVGCFADYSNAFQVNRKIFLPIGAFRCLRPSCRLFELPNHYLLYKISRIGISAARWGISASTQGNGSQHGK